MRDLLIAATSMVTPLGVCPKRVYASIEAGISRYKESDIFDPDDEPYRIASVPDDALKIPGKEIPNTQKKYVVQQRLLDLASTALARLKPKLPANKAIPLFIAGPDTSTSNIGVNQSFIQALEKLTGIPIDLNNSRAANLGRAGAINMLDIASRYFEFTDAEYAIVGGVDCYLDSHSLNKLCSENRLLRVNSTGGFVPAEGASFLLVMSPKASAKQRLQATAQVAEVSIKQAVSLGEEAPYSSAAGDIFAEVVKCIGTDVIPLTYSSANGEAHWFKELTTGLIRNRRYFEENHKFVYPAEYFGDVGAAFPAILIGLGIEKARELRQTKNQSHPIMVYCVSDSGLSAGLCLVLQ